MNDYRSIFALVSAAAGLTLLIAAARYSFSRKLVVRRRKRVLTSLAYGVLFLLAAGILWSRHDEQLTAKLTSPAPITKPTEQVTEAPATPQQATPPVTPTRTDTSVRGRAVDIETTEVKNEREAAVQAPVQPQPVTQRLARVVLAPAEPVVITPKRNQAKGISSTTDSPPKEPEARIVWVVNRTFAAIESFFNRYASPVSGNRATARRPTRSAPEIRFPRVTFEEQTAELSLESEAALKRLAKDLLRDPGVSLEIQARVDSVGPEAFNYMLTQARAAAVRDFLVVQGVPAERLIARGYGTQPFPQGTSNLIAFVVRR